jgi:hypothetical protein
MRLRIYGRFIESFLIQIIQNLFIKRKFIKNYKITKIIAVMESNINITARNTLQCIKN